MLLHENEPFADENIAELRKVKNLLKDVLLHVEDLPSALNRTEEDFARAINQINGAQNALQRYKVCFADEVKQKEQMRDRFLELRDKKD